ncbi:MAG: hypothetical protein IKB07_01455 [Lachnospiraceae bacterium]|nr:hypothetical protein [Lachnospiraceae bacterium]
MGKKIWWSALVCLLLCFVPGSCKKKETVPEVPLQEVWTEYETEETILAYTLDEEGCLYTLEYNLKAHADSGQLTLEELEQMTPEELERVNREEEDWFFLRKCNAKGEPVYSKALDRSLSSNVKAMAVKDGMVYFVPYTVLEGDLCAVLYSYCPKTEALTEVKALPHFTLVNRIIPMEDCFFLLGTSEENYFGGVSSSYYEYTGEKLFCYTVSEDKLVEVGIEEPMDICAIGEAELCIYAHMGEEFCLLSYDTEREAVKVLAKTSEYKMHNMTLANDGEDLIYQSFERGLVVSSLSDVDVESELYPDGFLWDNNLCCVNGRVACMTFDGSIAQFNLKDVKKESQVLRYIATGLSSDEPYGCGYKMQRTKLEEDKFAMKIMALDKDFDVCMVDTSYSFSHNLKKNGMFYPLNDVPGVQAYLDACFPYVREAATDEDGNIWMLPIAVDIPGIVVNEDVVADDLVMTDSMSLEAYFATYAALEQTDRKKVDMPYMAFWQTALRQYFAQNNSVDTEEFRKLAGVFSKYWTVLQDVGRAENGEMWHEYVRYGSDYDDYAITQMGENARVYEVPKVSPDSKNVGACVFLAVNPYSDNLDATLDYISSWIAYTMAREDVPVFFKDRVVGESVYETSLYELYRNGEIGFTLDGDICAGYDKVMEDSSKLEAYIGETERKLKIYLNE